MAKYLDLEVTLLGIKPRIWRRFLLAESATFLDLHDAIQGAMGWCDEHLYEFRDASGRRAIARHPHDDPDADRSIPKAGKARLSSCLTRTGMKCLYVYDFGDNWEHEVELKGLVDLPERFRQRLLDGARACPPEDCGGTGGYYACCAAVGAIDPKKLGIEEDDLADRKEWVGEDWRPDKYDLPAAQKRFDR